MTDRSKFEQMLEHLIADEQEKAKEIFHQLVVEKSREIYEEILAEDFQTEGDAKADGKEEDDEEVEESKKEDDEELDESDEKDDEEVEENFGFAEADDEEGDEVGGDATDDFMGDIEGGDDSGDADSEEDLEDRVVDLEDALDDLKAEFEKLMSGEEGDEMGADDEMGMYMGDEEEVKDSFDVSDNFMREYIEKVANPKGGDDGANAKSVVAGKNDMGGTTANIAKGGEAKGEGTKGGLLNPTAKEENFGNINVPGGKAGSAFSKKESGHGAEKKGAAESADNKQSLFRGRR